MDFFNHLQFFFNPQLSLLLSSAISSFSSTHDSINRFLFVKRSSDLQLWIFPAALTGLLLFVMLMPRVHPSSYIGSLATHEELAEQSERFIRKSGYSISHLQPFVVFHSDEDLLNRQIAHFGKKKLNRHIKNGLLHFIPSFYWQVLWISTGTSEQVQIRMDSYRQPDGYPVFRTVHSPGGAIQQFHLEDQQSWRLTTPQVDRSIVEEILQADSGERQSDSPAHRQIRSLLSGTVWNNYLMKLEAVESSERFQHEIIKVQLVPPGELLDHQTRIVLDICMDGFLRGVDQQIDFPGFESPKTGDVVDIIRIIITIILLLLLLILFFRRLFHQLIDVRAALIFAAVACVLSLMHMLLLLIQASAFTGLDQLFQFVAFFLILLLLCTIAGLAVLMIAGLVESYTREVWPEKITSTTLLRLGYLNSRQVGFSLINGIVAGLMFLGIAAAAYALMDHSFVNPLSSQVFFSDRYFLPPWHIFISGLFWSFLISAGILGSLISWLAVMNKNKGFLTAAGALAIAWITPLYVTPAGSAVAFAMVLIPAAAMTYAFLRNDLLSSGISVFFFVTIWITVDARLMAGSPDALLGWAAIGLALIPLGFGLYLVHYGKQYDHIPELTPKYIRQIAREQRVKNELEIARHVHQSFLPVNLPEMDGIRAGASCEAAFDVGGDYYDVIALDTSRIAFIIGDVSGKGIQAAFYMTLVKGIIQSLVKEIPEPVPLLTRLNRIFYENAQRGTFISVCYGLLDVSNGTLRYARAGHNPALYITNAHHEVTMLRSSGMAIGLTRDSSFESSLSEVIMSMQKGDTLLFYTDGVTEATNSRNEMLGEERLISLVGKHRNLEAPEMLLNVRNNILAFTGDSPPGDDMTMLSITYTGISSRRTKR